MTGIRPAARRISTIFPPLDEARPETLQRQMQAKVLVKNALPENFILTDADPALMHVTATLAERIIDSEEAHQFGAERISRLEGSHNSLKDYIDNNFPKKEELSGVDLALDAKLRDRLSGRSLQEMSHTIATLETENAHLKDSNARLEQRVAATEASNTALEARLVAMEAMFQDLIASHRVV